MSTRLAKRSVPMFLAATLDVGYSTFGLGRYLQFNPKKYRPPRPMGVKGGCSPQNNLPKSGQLLPELKRCRNKNFYKLYSPFRNSLVSPVRMSILRVVPAIWTAKNFQPLAQGCDARFNFT